MIAIIDSGGANIASVQFALERLGAQSVLTRRGRNCGGGPGPLPGSALRQYDGSTQRRAIG